MTSIYKYIIVSGKNIHDNLGHELFITRKLALFLLIKNIINKDICIVSCSKDRFFLYSNIFTNFLEYKEYVSLNIDNNCALDITPYLSIWLLTQNYNPLSIHYYENIDINSESYIKYRYITNGLKNILSNYDTQLYLNNNKIFNNYLTDDFNKLNCNFELCNVPISYDFFLLHIRYKINQNMVNYINNLINSINIPCVIFSSSLETYNLNYVYKTSNLQMYSSLLNNKSCKFLLSEWSGGGQLGQFCSKNIFYYFDTYNSPTYLEHNFNYFSNKNAEDFFNHWDFYNPYKSMCNISNNFENVVSLVIDKYKMSS